MKKFYKLFMLFLLLSIGQSAWCQTVVASGDLTSTVTWKIEVSAGGRLTRLRISGSGKIPNYSYSSSVPWANIDGYDYRSAITSIVVEEGITDIGTNVFANCSKVKEVTLNNRGSIGERAFYYCTALTTVTLNNTGTVGNEAFYNCSSLAQVNIGEGITGFEYASSSYDYPFSGCSNLATINVTDLKAYCSISNLDYLTDSYYGTAKAKNPLMINGVVHPSTDILEIPEGVTFISQYAFRYFSNITKIKIPSSLTEITDENFKNHTYLTEITVPSTVTSVGNDAFNGCTALKTASINNTGNIGNGVFKNCSALQAVTLNNTGTIGNSAFYKCSSLARVNIGNRVTGFEGVSSASSYDYPFYGCSKLAIVNAANLKAFCSISNLKYLTDGYYGTAEEKLFLRNGVSSTTVSLPEGTTYIPNCAFRYFPNIKHIVIPSTVTDIPDDNFAKHTYLTEVTLNNTGSIGEYAFSGCTALTTVTLNNKGSIGEYAFERCEALTRVNIGKGVTEFKSLSDSHIASAIVQSTPFYYSSNLSEVNVADLASFLKITNLKYLTYSYYGTAREKTLWVNDEEHDSSSELVIPEGVTEIDKYAFMYFKNVTKIKLPSTMTEIAYSNFSDHRYLTDVTVPSTVTYVGSYAFSSCSALKTVTLNNTDNIGDCAFSYCTALTNATLSSNVKSVGEYAFSNCTALTTVTLNNNGSIGEYAFKNCKALTRVNIGKGVTEFKSLPDTYDASYVASSYPFYGCSNLSVVNVADIASFLKITNLRNLTCSSYGGTASEKTLMVNGTIPTSLSELVIPEGVTEIDEYAFPEFKNVAKIKLPSTMTTIASYNFYGHSYLKKIILPSSVTYVGYAAFGYCTNLERIVCEATTPPVTASSIASDPSKISLKVPTGKTSAYKAADVWKEFSIDEGRTFNYSVTMLANESKQITNDLFDYLVVLKNTTTNSSIASPTYTSKTLTIKAGDVSTYDGTTTNSCKFAVIRLYLEDDDVLEYNVTVAPREVVLTDGDAYKNAQDFFTNKISYTRNFPEKIIGKWQCFYVPFDIEITDELLKGFDFAKLYMVSYQDANDNGEIEDGEPLKMILNKLSVGKILYANMPYYVRTKSSGEKTFEVTNTTLKAAANTSISCSTMEHEYTLTGIYSPTNIKGFYTMGTSGGFSYYTKDKTLNQYRWYMEIKSRSANGADMSNYARPIEIVVEGEDETTGIVALEDKASTPKNDKIYTLDGRQVTDYDNLPSGIYIINGKKVFKK